MFAKIDPIVLLLSFMVLTTLGMVLGCARWYPSDGQTFQVAAGVCTGLLGMLGLRIKAPGKTDADVPPSIPPPGATVKVTETTSSLASNAPAAKS